MQRLAFSLCVALGVMEKHVEIKGIGALIKREGYWEIEPINLNGATIYVEKETCHRRGHRSC